MLAECGRDIEVFRLRSTIYGRVVTIMTVASVVLFVAFSVIFRPFMFNIPHCAEAERKQPGAIVEGSLYKSMLENDKSTLHSTLDIINTMPGIEDVNLYDQNNSLAYSSFAAESEQHSNPDCLSCHSNLDEMFSRRERSYLIIDEKSDCSMNPGKPGQRHLLIRRPILNEVSCYTAACHAHTENDEVLGSLIIRMPLKDLDSALKKSSVDFLILSLVITAAVLSVLIFFTRKRIKNPLHSIIAASEAVSAGEVNTRLAIGPHLLDDMKKVSQAIHNMLDNSTGLLPSSKTGPNSLNTRSRKVRRALRGTE